MEGKEKIEIVFDNGNVMVGITNSEKERPTSEDINKWISGISNLVTSVKQIAKNEGISYNESDFDFSELSKDKDLTSYCKEEEDIDKENLSNELKNLYKCGIRVIQELGRYNYDKDKITVKAKDKEDLKNKARLYLIQENYISDEYNKDNEDFVKNVVSVAESLACKEFFDRVCEHLRLDNFEEFDKLEQYGSEENSEEKKDTGKINFISTLRRDFLHMTKKRKYINYRMARAIWYKHINTDITNYLDMIENVVEEGEQLDKTFLENFAKLDKYSQQELLDDMGYYAIQENGRK